MLGTWVNAAAILLGGALGLLLRGGIPQRLRETVMQGLGLCVAVIGILGAIETQNIMIIIVSTVLGGLLGEGIGIEKGMEAFGQRAQRLLLRGRSDQGNFAQGFLTASLVFCVGAMAIVGALDGGLRGAHETLYAKSMLDGVASIFFASAMGPGVLLSALPVLVYQGVIALSAQAVAPLLSEAAMREMSAVGGMLILGIGLNMLDIAKIRVGNLLPAIFIPLIYLAVQGFLG